MKILEGKEKDYKEWLDKNTDFYGELVLRMQKDGLK